MKQYKNTVNTSKHITKTPTHYKTHTYTHFKKPTHTHTHTQNVDKSEFQSIIVFWLVLKSVFWYREFL